MKTNLNTVLKNTISTGTKTVLVASLIGAISLPVMAKQYNNYANSNVDYARVVNVLPIHESIRVNEPEEYCWTETQRPQYRNSRQSYNSKTPEILGAVLGGVLGNRFGHGDGRKIATVAGAALGASIGHDADRRGRKNKHSRRHGSSYDKVQRCEVRDAYSYQEQVVGYDVEYKYFGKVYHTQTDQHPGKRIRVNVSVNPA